MVGVRLHNARPVHDHFFKFEATMGWQETFQEQRKHFVKGLPETTSKYKTMYALDWPALAAVRICGMHSWLVFSFSICDLVCHILRVNSPAHMVVAILLQRLAAMCLFGRGPAHNNYFVMDAASSALLLFRSNEKWITPNVTTRGCPLRVVIMFVTEIIFCAAVKTEKN